MAERRLWSSEVMEKIRPWTPAGSSTQCTSRRILHMVSWLVLPKYLALARRWKIYGK